MCACADIFFLQSSSALATLSNVEDVRVVLDGRSDDRVRNMQLASLFFPFFMDVCEIGPRMVDLLGNDYVIL